MKKIVYIILWVFLGLILSFIFHALIEIIYLNYTKAHNLTLHWTLSGACALPLWLIFLLPLLGIIFGKIHRPWTDPNQFSFGFWSRVSASCPSLYDLCFNKCRGLSFSFCLSIS